MSGAANVHKLPLAIGAPLGRILERLDKVRRAGKGYASRCPAHADRTASLSLSENAAGGALVHCFAGCSPAEVLAAVNLQLGDLFPERLKPVTPQERAEAARYSREAKWAAALGVVSFESCVLLAGLEKQRSGEGLTDEEHQRLQKAGELIRQSWEALRVR